MQKIGNFSKGKTMLTMKELEWDKLTFSVIATDYMYVAQCMSGRQWEQGNLVPYGDIAISPASGVLNYGQGVFEGLKAYRSQDGDKVFLFRPQLNAERMSDGCRRLCMPPIPEDVFMEGVTEVVKANQPYIPPYRPGASSQAALYLRPLLWGTGSILGVAPAPSYTFLVFASPVGPYFKGGLTPIKLQVSEEYYRAMPGGSGCVKAIGNYAPGMLAAKSAKKIGFSEIIYLDVRENRYVEEVGAANFFCVKGNTLFTPELDGCILPGITRRSVIHLAREMKMQVKEERLAIDSAIDADEAFASGTAAVISPIGSISYKGKEYVFNGGKIGAKTQKFYNTMVGIQHGLIPDSYGWIYEVDL